MQVQCPLLPSFLESSPRSLKAPHTTWMWFPRPPAVIAFGVEFSFLAPPSAPRVHLSTTRFGTTVTEPDQRGQGLNQKLQILDTVCSRTGKLGTQVLQISPDYSVGTCSPSSLTPALMPAQLKALSSESCARTHRLQASASALTITATACPSWIPRSPAER